MDQNNGLEAKISKEETRTLLRIDLGEVPLLCTRISPQDPTLHIVTTIRILEYQIFNAQISHSIEAMQTDLEMNPLTIRMEAGERMETFLVFRRLQGETSHKKNLYRQPKSDQPNNSAFRRSDDGPTTGFTPYEQKFPQTKNQTSSNVVSFTTTDDTINELSDLCPLNYEGFRTRTPRNLEIQDLASISYTSPPETLEEMVVWRLNSCWIQ